MRFRTLCSIEMRVCEIQLTHKTRFNTIYDHANRSFIFWQGVRKKVIRAKLHYTRTPAADMLYNTTNGRAHNNSTICSTTSCRIVVSLSVGDVVQHVRSWCPCSGVWHYGSSMVWRMESGTSVANCRIDCVDYCSTGHKQTASGQR